MWCAFNSQGLDGNDMQHGSCGRCYGGCNMLQAPSRVPVESQHACHRQVLQQLACKASDARTFHRPEQNVLGSLQPSKASNFTSAPQDVPHARISTRFLGLCPVLVNHRIFTGCQEAPVPPKQTARSLISLESHSPRLARADGSSPSDFQSATTATTDDASFRRASGKDGSMAR